MNELENKMSSAVLHYEKELNTLRTSRANPSMLDNIFVDAYGSKTPLNQLGNISVQDASTITIQIWDSSLVKSIENANAITPILLEIENTIVKKGLYICKWGDIGAIEWQYI